MVLVGRYVYSLVVFFFFKQKTAYEMRISDWSSDVCSSDLSSGLSRRVRIERRTLLGAAGGARGAGGGTTGDARRAPRVVPGVAGSEQEPQESASRSNPCDGRPWSPTTRLMLGCRSIRRDWYSGTASMGCHPWRAAVVRGPTSRWA